MKTRFLSVFLILSLAMPLLAGCSITAELPAAALEGATTIHFNGDTVAITGTGAVLDKGEVLISQAGTYRIYGTCDHSRVIVKAEETDDVTIVLAGLTLTNPEDEAIYFKTCRSAAVILEENTENILTSGTEPAADEETTTAVYTSEEEREEEDSPSGAVLRALCAMTVEGQGSLTVKGYINNGIAADGGLTISSGTYHIYAVNDGLKSDLDVTVTGGVFTIQTECDGVQAGGTLDISGGDITVFTGAGAAGADMKVSDSLMMGNMGGGGGGNRGRSSQESASAEASTEADTENAAETPSGDPTVIAEETTTAADAASAEQPQDTETTGTDEASASGEMNTGRGMSMPGGSMDDWMDLWDTDTTDSPSRKGLKAAEAIVISGGNMTVDAEDDAIHCDGSVTITGGTFTLSSGDDGIHGETVLDISGGELDILLCYEGMEAKAIYISDGYMNITATDDGMNAGGSSGEMMGGMGGMRNASREASSEAEGTTTETADTAASGEMTATEDEITASGEVMEAITTASGEAEALSSETEEETIETVVRITGGTIIVDSGGDGLDSNASMYIEGGVIFVSGPSSNWDSPIDYGEGSSEFVISGGFLMAAGYSGMFESPDTTDASQSSLYYVQSGYAPDNAVTTLKKADGTVLAEYAFSNSYNGVLISTPEMAAGETYTLTIDGVDTAIEMTSAQYSNRGGSGEMGGMGPGGRR